VVYIIYLFVLHLLEYTEKLMSSNTRIRQCRDVTFLLSVPQLVVTWSYPGRGYNSATGHFVWLVRSPGTVSHCTFVPHWHYQL